MGSNAEMFCVEIETCVESSHYGVLHVREGPPQPAVARRRGGRGARHRADGHVLVDGEICNTIIIFHALLYLPYVPKTIY